MLKPLKPFMRDTVRAEIPTRLGAGNYRVKAYIDNGTTEIYAGEHALHVSPYGSVSGHEGYGFAGLSARDQLSIFGIAAGVLIFSMLGIWVLRQRKALS
ncbi:MAG: hypothetical protein A2934_05530 [Candidatus Sungbacteria bacterium RIFCSPLOWO2_01_FULL_47_10]|uniref:Uncharacterized protein n=1 Tax=Candidatus Sungbacteria bacterium RIFCSPLOWO2_01_FULL_47_10 TaxID=1802276 RepID=A0A1G2L683_9BACT|nr:MAG: hypothetical protein A2934_05530 [Candidatus Sungbacteria bacterium RIFCSPLOWO2_01_FULL_47_10]